MKKIALMLIFMIAVLIPASSMALLPGTLNTAISVGWKFKTSAGAPVTGIVIANIDVYLKKPGESAYTKYDCVTSSPTSTQRICREIGRGTYEVDLNSTDMNTSGFVYVNFNDTTAATSAVDIDQLVCINGTVDCRLDAQVTTYASGQNPADYVLATPANKLTTDASGQVDLRGTESTGASCTAGSYGCAFRAIIDMFSNRRANPQAATANTITLDSGATAVDNIYQWWSVSIVNGTGNDQCRLIPSYNGTTKVADVRPNWITIPNTGSTFQLSRLGCDKLTVNDVTGSVNSVTTGVTVTTNNDKANYNLADNAINKDKVADVLEAELGIKVRITVLAGNTHKFIIPINETISSDNDWVKSGFWLECGNERRQIAQVDSTNKKISVTPEFSAAPAGGTSCTVDR